MTSEVSPQIFAFRGLARYIAHIRGASNREEQAMSQLFGRSAARGLILGCLAATLAGATAVRGETSAARLRAADQQVQEALHREIYGLETDRLALLAEATKKVPGYAPAMWQLGYLKDQRNRWIKADEYLRQETATPLAAYKQARESHADSVEGQLALAQWCAEKKLFDQARAHWNRVLQLEPNQRTARAALGFQWIGGLWVSREEREGDIQLANQERESLVKFGDAMREIAAGLSKGKFKRREAAAKKLLAIHDAAAIPAMEAIVSPTSDDAARLVVEALAAIRDPAASLSLARHAVYYPSQVVREAAAIKLRGRDKYGYVPQLIGMLYLPVRSEVTARLLPSGRIGYRHSFIREGLDRNELLVLDTEYFRVSLPGGNVNLSAARAAADAAETAQQRELAAEEQNRFQSRLNDRITRALQLSTEQNLPARPESWWSWWNDHNELLIQGSKTLLVSQEYRSSSVVDIVPQTGGGQTGAVGECLVAGTPIWTAAGPLAVEKIKVGDLVLAQDAESGELALKPVLRATVRPRGPTIKLTAGQESLEASGGHVFWVAGDGWRKASELKSGMVMHALGGPVLITSTQSGSIAQTYNLVVADFSTYFVGRQKILSHDFTMRRPSRTVVPGLREE